MQHAVSRSLRIRKR